jgi:hypothetical protein
MAHVNGQDERAAFGSERALWRGFIKAGLVDAGIAMSYIARLDEARARIPARPDRSVY